MLAWFRQNARALPWRETRDPYAIWISEVMLQQTQVQTVIPYWQRWMEEMPDVQALARSKFDRILKLWEGLGYYSRARNLHQAARIIVEQHGGALPRSYREVLSLPGIGRYTAGAVCSIAFDQPTPILDGNAVRVLARLFGVRGNVRSKPINARLWKLAQQLVQGAVTAGARESRPCSSFNQALMELGATVCKPKQPECDRCPVRQLCVARRTRRTGAIPNLGERPQSTRRRFVAFVPCAGQRHLVQQRPSGAVNAHLWEFPNLEVNGSEASLEELARRCLGCTPASIERLCTVHHTITRFRIRLDVYQARLAEAAAKGPGPNKWCTVNQMKKLAFPSAHRKIVAALEGKA